MIRSRRSTPCTAMRLASIVLLKYDRLANFDRNTAVPRVHQRRADAGFAESTCAHASANMYGCGSDGAHVSDGRASARRENERVIGTSLSAVQSVGRSQTRWATICCTHCTCIDSLDPFPYRTLSIESNLAHARHMSSDAIHFYFG